MTKEERDRYAFVIDKAELIRTGYRVNYRSKWQCVRSLARLTNQTFNILTMVVATFVSFGIAAYAHANRPPHRSEASVAPMYVLALSVLVHMVPSVAFHMFNCLSPAEHTRWQSWDFFWMFACSPLNAFGIAYYVFGSSPAHAVAATLLVLMLAIPGARFSISRSQAAITKAARAQMIGETVFGFLLPIPLRVLAFPHTPTFPLHMASIYVVNGVSAWVYATRWPESRARRWQLGCTPVHSHALMHWGHVLSVALIMLYCLRCWRCPEFEYEASLPF